MAIERGGTWDKGKGFDTFGPIGPWLVTADEVADPQNLELWLEVDGKRYQNGNTRTMVFGVAEIVSYLSRCMSLQPGDIISTGTPPAWAWASSRTRSISSLARRCAWGSRGLGSSGR